jgi:iron complex transport system substrate-binding protein
MKKRFILLMILILLICGGCQGKVENQTNEISANEVKTGTNSTSNTTEDAESETYTLVDMSGREVQVKRDIKTVFATGPVANIIVYTINSKLMAGVNWAPSETEKEFLDSYYIQLPVLGGWYGNGNEGNVEEIMKANPDLIINAGTLSEDSIEFSDSLQEQLGIPVINVDFDLENMAKAYDFLGQVLNEKERTDELAAYIEEAYEDVEQKKKEILDSEKVTVYYAEGPEGLETDPEGSSHSELISYVGGINIAQVEISEGYGRSTVSIEQLINWNPDVVLACPENDGSSAYDVFMENDTYKTIEAVKTGRIYDIPDKPFKWFDRPPSSNRIIGIKWTANALYPDVYQYDMKEETKKFYELFYRCTLTEEQVNDLLDRSLQ